MSVEERVVDGLNGLLQTVLEIISTTSPDSFLWFRGMNQSQYPLLPRLLRESKSSSEIVDREKRLLTRFRQRSLPYWPAGYPQNDWEHLFAMQHFGIPTRLLDWTENLFVAAHFALQPDTPTNEETKPVVWVVDPVKWNRSSPSLKQYGDSIHVFTITDDDLKGYEPSSQYRRSKSPVTMFGTHNSGRIVAQRGTFMIWGDDARPMEEFANEFDISLWRLEISGPRKRLARDLQMLGFGETMVFPDLPSLATELSRIEGWRV